MTHARIRRTVLATLLAVGLHTAAADAKGGKDPAPAPQPPAPALDCFTDPAIVAMTTPDIGVNTAGQAGCVGVRNLGSSLQLAFVVVNPGWTYEVLSNGGGTSSRVQLKFSNASTGGKVDFRYEFGKTVIS